MKPHFPSASRARFLAPGVLFLATLWPALAAHAATAPEPPAVRTRLVTVRAADLAMAIELTGTVRPVDRATVSAKVMGVIEEMPLLLGQRVRAGETLVRIAAGEIAARLVQAQSQLQQAERDRDRERGLLARNASTADTVRNLEDRVVQTQAMVREAETMLGYATLRAPFDGIVARKLAQAGDLAAPGQPLLELEGIERFQVEVGIPDSSATRLLPGATVRVEIPASGAAFSAPLAELSSASDAQARSVLARFAIPAGTSVRSGQFARVHVPGPAARALLVPAGAVSRFGQMERVFVAGEDGRAILRLVRTGGTFGDQIEILSGLADGERIVAAPVASLREGTPLEVLP